MKLTPRKTLITLSTIALAAVHGAGNATEATAEDRPGNFQATSAGQLAIGNNGGGAIYDRLGNFEKPYRGVRGTHGGELPQPSDARVAPRALFRDYVEPRPLPGTQRQRR